MNTALPKEYFTSVFYHKRKVIEQKLNGVSVQSSFDLTTCERQKGNYDDSTNTRVGVFWHNCVRTQCTRVHLCTHSRFSKNMYTSKLYTRYSRDFLVILRFWGTVFVPIHKIAIDLTKKYLIFSSFSSWILLIFIF